MERGNPIEDASDESTAEVPGESVEDVPDESVEDWR
jgi:hypothetical protein